MVAIEPVEEQWKDTRCSINCSTGWEWVEKKEEEEEGMTCPLALVGQLLELPPLESKMQSVRRKDQLVQ